MKEIIIYHKKLGDFERKKIMAIYKTKDFIQIQTVDGEIIEIKRKDIEQ